MRERVTHKIMQFHRYLRNTASLLAKSVTALFLLSLCLLLIAAIIPSAKEGYIQVIFAPYAAGTFWERVAALSGWAAAIGTFIAAAITVHFLRKQILRTDIQIDETVRSNAIAQLEAASLRLQFIEEEEARLRLNGIINAAIPNLEQVLSYENAVAVFQQCLNARNSLNIELANSRPECVRMLTHHLSELRNQFHQRLEVLFSMELTNNPTQEAQINAITVRYQNDEERPVILQQWRECRKHFVVYNDELNAFKKQLQKVQDTVFA